MSGHGDVLLIRRHTLQQPMLWMLALTGSTSNHGTLFFATGSTQMWKAPGKPLSGDDIIFNQLISAQAAVVNVLEILESLPRNDNKSFVLSGLEALRRVGLVSYTTWLACMRHVTCPPSPLKPLAKDLSMVDLTRASLSIVDLWIIRKLLSYVSAQGSPIASAAAVGLSAGDGKESHSELDTSGATVVIRWKCTSHSPLDTSKPSIFLSKPFSAAISKVDTSKFDLKPSTAELTALKLSIAGGSAASPNETNLGRAPSDQEFERLISQMVAPTNSSFEKCLSAARPFFPVPSHAVTSQSAADPSSRTATMTNDEFSKCLSETFLPEFPSFEDLWGTETSHSAARSLLSSSFPVRLPAAGPAAVRPVAVGTSPASVSRVQLGKTPSTTLVVSSSRAKLPTESRTVLHLPPKRADRLDRLSAPTKDDPSLSPTLKKSKHSSQPLLTPKNDPFPMPQKPAPPRSSRPSSSTEGIPALHRPSKETKNPVQPVAFAGIGPVSPRLAQKTPRLASSSSSERDPSYAPRSCERPNPPLDQKKDPARKSK